MRHIKSLIDRRIKRVRTMQAAAYVQMDRYFTARYSWGQGCDPARAHDWAALCMALDTQTYRGEYDPCEEWRAEFLFERFKWPSGNVGSIVSMVRMYHDGWDLLREWGLVASLDDDEEVA
jgi:hypothetical protein